jgi:biopolymer transport protein ExbB/TolQ
MLSGIFSSINVGVFFALTGIAFVLVLSISVERFYTLYFKFRLRVPPFKSALEEALREMDLNKALRIADLNPNHPVCKAARAGLMKANAGDRERMRAMESTTLELMPKVSGWTNILGMLGNLGTLLGLIGTVIGMINAFEGLGVSDSGAKQEILARGIAVAMQSTALGLVVAIPATLLATVFSGRQERLLDQVDEVSASISSHLSQANRESASRH